MSASVTTSEKSMREFIESNPQAAPDELRERMGKYGYLFFRSIVPADAILTVRRDILQLCREAGWLDESHDLMDGVVRESQEPLVEGQPEYMDAYRKIIRLPSFMAFAEQEPLQAIARKLLGEKIIIHRRHIGRITFPNHVYDPTPPHQDFYYIRGSVETYTCWVPLGACPKEMGGLAVWPGSHEHGFMSHDAENPKAVVAVGIEVNEDEAEWHTGDFGLGDALFFHSYTIHKALPNLTPNLLRLSTDNRYQREGDEITEGSLQPHLPSRG